MLSQAKKKSQHVTWSLEYGKTRNKLPRMPSSNTQKLVSIITGIQKIRKQYFKFSPQSTQKPTPFNTGIRKIRKEYLTYIPCSNLGKLKPFGGTGIRKIRKKNLTCPIQTYASGSSHARKTVEEAGVHKHQQEEDEEEAVQDGETVP